MRMLNTFFKELTTQSNTAFNFGTRFMVLSGRRTRRTRRDLIVLRFCPVELPLEIKENEKNSLESVLSAGRKQDH